MRGGERYQFTWPDKKKSVVLANQPTSKTLRLVREKSVGRDGTPGSIDTENIYIEGDNLDALKILQETYLGKVKMIYIDPPYNTGNDFIYEDDFSQSSDEYLGNSGQTDDEGNRLVQNTESNGRFHTDWLNMIYPRLRLAKDLLSEDGVIFISIDDHEQDNLIKICNEIFGPENKVVNGVVQRSTNGLGDKKGFAQTHEYLICYQKTSQATFNGLTPNDEYLKSFDKEDEYGKYKIDGILMKKGAGSKKEDAPSLYFPLYFSAETGNVSLTKLDGYVERYPIKADGTDGRWTWGKEKIRNENYRLYASPNGTIYIKDYYSNNRRMKIKSTLNDPSYLTDRATNEIKKIFQGKLFDTPKPMNLIKDLCDLVTSKDDLVLDFFGGSSTTAHAVMHLNAQDKGKRQFIMIQLPERCPVDSEAYKMGYMTICDIGEERIRRVGKIKENLLDIGFRVFKVDSSNMKDVYYRPDDLNQDQLDLFADNIKEDRSPEDLLFQVMLDLGVLLSSKIEENIITDKKVFSVADGYLIACFDSNVTDDVVIEIAKRKPFYAVFRDNSMASDSVATNFDQIFETYSPKTVRKVL